MQATQNQGAAVAEAVESSLLDNIVAQSRVARSETEHARAKDIIAELVREVMDGTVVMSENLGATLDARVAELVREVNDLYAYRLPMKQLEADFHESFITVYGNEQVSLIYARLLQKMYLFRLHNLDAVGPANTLQSMREHLAVIDALEAGNTDAAIHALDAHLKGVLHRVLTT